MIDIIKPGDKIFVSAPTTIIDYTPSTHCFTMQVPRLNMAFHYPAIAKPFNYPYPHEVYQYEHLINTKKEVGDVLYYPTFGDDFEVTGKVIWKLYMNKGTKGDGRRVREYFIEQLIPEYIDPNPNNKPTNRVNSNRELFSVGKLRGKVLRIVSPRLGGYNKKVTYREELNIVHNESQVLGYSDQGANYFIVVEAEMEDPNSPYQPIFRISHRLIRKYRWKKLKF